MQCIKVTIYFNILLQILTKVNYFSVIRYDYFDLCNNVSTFPRPRFASEFGFQSYPSFYSLSKIASPSVRATDYNNICHLFH